MSESVAATSHQFRRAAGVLLHPTALPGPFGVGDLGPNAYRFLELLRLARQQYWQILPLGPVGESGSPYTSTSAFAGNPLLISPEQLVADGYLAADDLAGAPAFSADRVDFSAARDFKSDLLQRAFDRFRNEPDAAKAAAFAKFGRRHRGWLGDFALFEALRTAQGTATWPEWPAGLARRRTAALTRARRDLHDEVEFHRFEQFLFFEQWQALRSAAREAGISILGDLPIFIAHDSADVWCNQDIFALDAAGRPATQAGVPPDAFSATGQLWGNPLYRWEMCAATDYAWWTARYRAVLELVDAVRIDHFRGFEAYWEVPAGAETAEGGRWVSGPGRAVFDAAARELGRLPIIVEDLGLITPEVHLLRDTLGYPGMKVLQFAFDSGPGSPYLPHNYDRNCVVYTGTHDNDTTRGWFECLPADIRQNVLDYTGSGGDQIHWDLIRLALSSVADLAIVPLQDLLGLGSEARFNLPGQAEGNWAWRLHWDQVPVGAAKRLARLTEIFGRAAEFVTY